MAPSSKDSAKVPTSVNEYSVLHLSLPSTKSFPKQATHYLYIRPNAPKIPTPTTPRELFVVNIPIATTPSHLRTLFNTHLGGFRISDITFDTTTPSTPTQAAPSRKRKRRAPVSATALPSFPDTTDRTLHPSGSSAILTFVDDLSAASAMRAVRTAAKARTSSPWPVSSSDWSVAPLGSARYKTLHALRYPPPEELQANVDQYMSVFNSLEADRAKEVAKKRAEPDEDGFVTVVRGGRNKTANESGMKEGLEKQKKKMEGLEDFYRFQGREKRRKEAEGLKRGFEEDRRRVEGLRRARPE